MGAKTVKLRPNEEYITLQSLLKSTNTISTGGMAKIYLLENTVLVNGEPENRRGRKLYSGDLVELEDATFAIK